MPAITPMLWFDSDFEAAVRFYTSVFPDSSIERMLRIADAGPAGRDEVVAGTFMLAGNRMGGLNGGPAFTFSEAVSFLVHCADQDEVDYYWDRLTDGGAESECGWLKDKFGVSWQIVPDRLFDLMADPDPARAAAAVSALHTMRKIVLADIEDAMQAVTA